MDQKTNTSDEKMQKAPETERGTAFTSQGRVNADPLTRVSNINELQPSDTGGGGASEPLEGCSSAVERLDHTQDVGGSIPSSPTPILPQLNASTIARFWRKVKITKPDECWEWTASRFTAKKEQYGCFHIGKRTLTASRVAYAIGNGEEPGRASVLHNCDNPPCCNPAHLYLGTQADNGRDMRLRKRARGAPRPGSKNHFAKLNEAQVPCAA